MNVTKQHKRENALQCCHDNYLCGIVNFPIMKNIFIFNVLFYEQIDAIFIRLDFSLFFDITFGFVSGSLAILLSVINYLLSFAKQNLFLKFLFVMRINKYSIMVRCVRPQKITVQRITKRNYRQGKAMKAYSDFDEWSEQRKVKQSHPKAAREQKQSSKAHAIKGRGWLCASACDSQSRMSISLAASESNLL